MSAPVRIIFLGGLGEIGRNCFCIEAEGRILVVDCGLMFPDADMPGVDLVLPDIRFVEDNLGSLKGIVITHAHEDHYGALMDFWPKIQAPVFMTPFAAALLRTGPEHPCHGLIGFAGQPLLEVGLDRRPVAGDGRQLPRGWQWWALRARGRQIDKIRCEFAEEYGTRFRAIDRFLR